MPSSNQQPARLTKKQKKATAFRERGSNFKGKGKGKGKNNPSPGRLRPFTTGDNGEDGDDDEDANALPAMEDQDQALAEMAGDAKGDGGRAVRVPKTAVESTVAQSKGKITNKRQRGSRVEDGEAQPRAKKPRLARSAEEVLPPAARLNAVKDGDGEEGSKADKKESKTLRYILFVGKVLPLLSSPSDH